MHTIGKNNKNEIELNSISSCFLCSKIPKHEHFYGLHNYKKKAGYLYFCLFAVKVLGKPVE